MESSIYLAKINSQQKLEKLRAEITNIYREDAFFSNLCIYACGSLGRLEMTNNSDLDLFFISMENDGESSICDSSLKKYIFFSELYKINKKLGYQDPSKQGLYWEFIKKQDLLDIGSREEDYINSFTARMLLILESKSIYNDFNYNRLLDEVINSYFKDYIDYKDEFYPLFLMNDILRYWYTLTLNYEYRRDDRDDNSKKYWLYSQSS